MLFLYIVVAYFVVKNKAYFFGHTLAV